MAMPRPMSTDSNGNYIAHILMVGDSSSGKTSLVLRFDLDVFTSKFVTTIGVDHKDKIVKVDGLGMRLQIWDTAGQERFRSLTSNFFGRADGFVCTYDVSSRTSFEHVSVWMQDIHDKAPKDVKVVLCGNKSDLGEERVVTAAEGGELAEEFGIPYFEASAKTGDNVSLLFMDLTKSIKESRLPRLLEFDSSLSSERRRKDAAKSHESAFRLGRGGESKNGPSAATTFESCCL